MLSDLRLKKAFASESDPPDGLAMVVAITNTAAAPRITQAWKEGDKFCMHHSFKEKSDSTCVRYSGRYHSRHSAFS